MTIQTASGKNVSVDPHETIIVPLEGNPGDKFDTSTHKWESDRAYIMARLGNWIAVDGVVEVIVGVS